MGVRAVSIDDGPSTHFFSIPVSWATSTPWRSFSSQRCMFRQALITPGPSPAGWSEILDSLLTLHRDRPDLFGVEARGIQVDHPNPAVVEYSEVVPERLQVGCDRSERVVRDRPAMLRPRSVPFGMLNWLRMWRALNTPSRAVSTGSALFENATALTNREGGVNSIGRRIDLEPVTFNSRPRWPA